MSEHHELVRTRIVILVLCVGEWIFAVLYAQHGDLLPIYVIVAAFAKEHIHRRAKKSAWDRQDDNVRFAKGLE